MKPTIFRYGFYAVLVAAGSAIIQFIIFPKCSFETQEVIGYLTILLAMIFVFMGIRHYRNHVNKGTLSFGQGLKIGVLIILVPSVFFGLFDIFYSKIINPNWQNDYVNHYAEKIRSTSSPEQAQAKLDQLHSQVEMFNNPLMQFVIMFGTVFVIGFIVTIISSLTLMKKQKLSISELS